MNAAEVAARIETEMLQNLARLLTNGNAEDAEWQFQKLRQLGLLTEMNAQAVRKYRDDLLQAVREEIEYKAFERATMIDDATRGAGKSLSEVLPPNADPALVNLIRTWERSAVMQLGDAQAVLLSGAEDRFQDAVAKATAKVQMGVPGRQAMAEVCDELAEIGLSAIADTSGRMWSLESYAQLAVRSNSARAAAAVQWERMDELGEDLIEVSSHLGARPKCAPYQGRVYSRSGSSKNYPPLSSTSYGEPDGLFGINCRHVAYPYFPGTEKTFKPYGQERNREAYAEEQKQRAMERGIRKAKLALSLVEQAGDARTVQKIKDRIAERQAAIREFIEETGRKRQYGRERIRGTSS